MKICGIDPGNKGAICVLDTSIDPIHIAFLDLQKSTIYEATVWLYKQQVNQVWIEDVHSMHGMSAKSNFGFGRNLGIVIAIAEMATKNGLVKKVTPKIWQKYIKITAKGKRIKKSVANKAIQIYPNASIHGARGGLLDGRSDALMIAHYAINHP